MKEWIIERVPVQSCIDPVYQQYRNAEMHGDSPSHKIRVNLLPILVSS